MGRNIKLYLNIILNILQSGILMKLYFLDKVYKELTNILLLTYKKKKKQLRQTYFLSELYSLASYQSMQNTNFFSMIQNDDNLHMQLNNTLQYTMLHDLLIEMVISVLILNGPILFCFLTQSTFHSFYAFSSGFFFFLASNTYFSPHSAYLLKATLSPFLRCNYDFQWPWKIHY